MGETGVLLEPKPPKVIARKGQNKICYRTSGQKVQITVIGCGNVVGNLFLHLSFLSQSSSTHCRQEVMSVVHDTELVIRAGWIKNYFPLDKGTYFLVNAVPRQPLLFLLNGHSPYVEPKSIQFAKDNSIIIFCLPPHTTRVRTP